jgi:hypothetical protein
MKGQINLAGVVRSPGPALASDFLKLGFDIELSENRFDFAQHSNL